MRKLLSRKSRNQTGTLGGSVAQLDAHSYLQSVYRDPMQPDNIRMRAAMAAIEYERPKLGVSININDDGSFAARLDAAIARSNGVKVIEHKANGNQAQVGGEAAEISASKMRSPMLPSPLRRRI